MAGNPWGYRRGPLEVVKMYMDSATAAVVVPGDFVVAVTAGYVGSAAAGGTPIGVAMSGGADPSADGAAEVLVSIHPDAVYEYPADTGTVTQALCNTTMDIGGAQSIDIDASTDDVIQVIEVNTDRNSLFVKLIPTRAGVV